MTIFGYALTPADVMGLAGIPFALYGLYLAWAIRRDERKDDENRASSLPDKKPAS